MRFTEGLHPYSHPLEVIMKYEQIMRNTDTVKALTMLGFETKQSGGYVYFECPDCKGKAVAKAFGEKKNLIYCTKCKKSGQIIALVQRIKGIEYEQAVEALKSSITTDKKPESLKVSYDLQYHGFLKDLGITEETCQKLEIGVPKGKTMLAGCVAFKITDNGNPIAYYGIRMKDLKPVFHRSFNPELVIYQLNGKECPIFTTSLFDCVRNYQEGKASVCNFGLPYISAQQAEILNGMNRIIFQVPPEQKKDFSYQAMELKTFYRFL